MELPSSSPPLVSCWAATPVSQRINCNWDMSYTNPITSIKRRRIQSTQPASESKVVSRLVIKRRSRDPNVSESISHVEKSFLEVGSTPMFKKMETQNSDDSSNLISLCPTERFHTTASLPSASGMASDDQSSLCLAGDFSNKLSQPQCYLSQSVKSFWKAPSAFLRSDDLRNSIFPDAINATPEVEHSAKESEDIEADPNQVDSALQFWSSLAVSDVRSQGGMSMYVYLIYSPPPSSDKPAAQLLLETLRDDPLYEQQQKDFLDRFLHCVEETFSSDDCTRLNESDRLQDYEDHEIQLRDIKIEDHEIDSFDHKRNRIKASDHLPSSAQSFYMIGTQQTSIASSIQSPSVSSILCTSPLNSINSAPSHSITPAPITSSRPIYPTSISDAPPISSSRLFTLFENSLSKRSLCSSETPVNTSGKLGHSMPTISMRLLRRRELKPQTAWSIEPLRLPSKVTLYLDIHFS